MSFSRYHFCGLCFCMLHAAMHAVLSCTWTEGVGVKLGTKHREGTCLQMGDVTKPYCRAVHAVCILLKQNVFGSYFYQHFWWLKTKVFFQTLSLIFPTCASREVYPSDFGARHPKSLSYCCCCCSCSFSMPCTGTIRLLPKHHWDFSTFSINPSWKYRSPNSGPPRAAVTGLQQNKGADRVLEACLCLLWSFGCSEMSTGLNRRAQHGRKLISMFLCWMLLQRPPFWSKIASVHNPREQAETSSTHLLLLFWVQHKANSDQVFLYPVQKALLQAFHKNFSLDSAFIVWIVKAALLIKISSLLPWKLYQASTETGAKSHFSPGSPILWLRLQGMVVVMPLWFKRVFPAQHSHMPLLCAGIWSGRSFSIPPLTNHTRSLICSFQHMQNCFLQGWHLTDLLMTYTELGFVRLCRIRPSNGNKKKLGKVNNGIKNICTQSCLLTAIFHW